MWDCPCYRQRMNLVPLVLCFLSLGRSEAVETRDVTALDPTALQVFLQPFREAVLHKVAVGWNHTIADSAKLKTDMQTCSDTIRRSVDTCKTCTAAACSGKVTSAVVDSSPEFTDYLKFALTLLNPLTFLKDPLNDIGNRLGDLVDLVGDGSQSFIDSMADLGGSVGDKFTDIFHGLESAINTVKDTLTNVGNTAIDGIKDLGSSIGDGVSGGVASAGHALEHAGHSILHGLGSIFGRRRRDVTPEIRHCMEQCPSCNALLITDQQQMITSVCGADVVKFNDTVRKHVHDIKGVFMAVSDKVNPVVVKLEYDPSSLSGSKFTRVFITANIRGRYVRYQSTQAYDMINYATSAQNIADEFWTMWTM